ncbi:Similar to MPI: Mannose-6-phosphate isomerase (Macaca fascicularis) [Cotesia congregata]|uniref:Mannose-6-phosphate isomerase n=1 Tax=Cotesia congregata TaxID=51543 RepID=A0A8J2HL94_COTCN|nr:Similar to MPI: Mannose-6-phosphate isomerase (Macaca fascicularis) [Cotesia congregata]
MELECAVQNYDWGKKGMASSVAQLIKSSSPELNIEQDKPYAELWMGTHVNGPSFIKGTKESLADYITKDSNSHVLGDKVKEVFGNTLPFLFKVLSIDKALSIQAHPAKAHAEELHQLFPSVYKDPNHKPELAIALTPFQGLCGFRPVQEIRFHLNSIPELVALCDQTAVDDFLNCQGNPQIHLKKCFKSLLTFATTDGNSGDIGCFGIYFFNYINLNPGEALYLGPNVPHAYLYGDCVECMACSDNVVRAGLTPKLKDVPTLIEMLSYQSQSYNKFEPKKIDEFSEVFQPPIKDFAVAKIQIPGSKSYKFVPVNSPSIVIIIQGSVKIFDKVHKRGSVLFTPANSELAVTNLEEEKSLIFQAFANVNNLPIIN